VWQHHTGERIPLGWKRWFIHSPEELKEKIDELNARDAMNRIKSQKARIDTLNAGGARVIDPVFMP
jgi:hypothetical protein